MNGQFYKILCHPCFGHSITVHQLGAWITGRKVYITKCRCRGRQIKMTIGAHGPLTVEQARIKGREIIAEAKAGRDPSAAYSQLRKYPPSGSVLHAYLQGWCFEMTIWWSFQN